MRSLLAVLLATPGAAQEFIQVPGRLSDEAFYRVVACAAPPGGACQKPFLHWPAEKRDSIAVALLSVASNVAPYKRRLFDQGVDAAIAEINGLDAGITLVRTLSQADIGIHIVATPPNQVMAGTGEPQLDGQFLQLGRVILRVRDGMIADGVIAISGFAPHREIASVLLEEMTQALGLITDIRGPAYRRSLFSEDGNAAVRLAGQDAMALRRHYAPGGEGDD